MSGVNPQGCQVFSFKQPWRAQFVSQAEAATVGLDIDQATQKLASDGIEKSRQPFDKLLETLQRMADEQMKLNRR
jgi:hypothetical protein